MFKESILFVITDAVTLNSGGTAAITSGEVDTIQNGVKYRYAEFIIRTGTLASSAALTACKVASSDTSGGGLTDVTGAAFAADVISNANSSSDKFFKIVVDLEKNLASRYLKMVVSTDDAANSAIDSIWCVLSHGEKEPPADSVFGGVVRV